MDALQILDTSRRLLQAGTPHALVTVVRAEAPTSAKPGDKAVVTSDGQIQGWIGGGCAQPAVLRTVQRVLAEGRGRLIRIAPAAEGELRELGDVLEFGMACHSGGTLELFVDAVLPRAQLVVIGASPVAAALVQLAPRVGFEVLLAAPGAEAAAHPDARQVIASDDAAQVAPQVIPGAWVVVATQGRRDVQGLRLALSLPARQVSLVASGRKAQVLKDALVAAGADAAAVAAIVAPAGYPMGAHTPEEIALSVLAAVVSARRGGGAVVAAGAAASHAPVAQAASMPAAAQADAGPPDAGAPAGQARALEAITPLAEAAPSCCGGAAAAAPVAAAVSSCCGGAAMAAPVIAAPAAVQPAETSTGSCCDGAG